MKGLVKNPHNRKKILLFLGDVVLLSFIVSVTPFIYKLLKEQYAFRIFQGSLRLYALFFSSVIYLAALYVFEMYEIRQRYGRIHIVASVSSVALASFVIMFALAKILRINQATMLHIFIFFILSVFILSQWRRFFIKKLLTSDYFTKKTLFVGRDLLMSDIFNEMKRSDYRLAGVISNDDKNLVQLESSMQSLGGLRDMGNVMDSEGIRVIVTALGESLPLNFMRRIYQYKLKGIEVYDTDYFYEILTRKVAISRHLKESQSSYFDIDVFTKPIRGKLKRLVDFFAALSLFILVLPLFLFIALLIKVVSVPIRRMPLRS